MSEILIVVPVLNRPANVEPLVESLRRSEADCELLFVCSPSDHDELRAVYTAGVSHLLTNWEPGPGDFARKQNAAFAQTTSPYVLCAADDLRFHPGWDSALLAVAREFDVGVVGTNDLGNGAVLSGRHSTHPLVSRCYIDTLGGYVGGEGKVYFEGYDHQYVDVELVETAMARGCYAHCSGAVVEHLHPLWRKGADDKTYRKGQAHRAADARLYQSRRHLWLAENATRVRAGV